MINTFKDTILKFIAKKRLGLFFNKYIRTKEKAITLMNNGDLNAYLQQLIETEKTKKKAMSLLIQSC